MYIFESVISYKYQNQVGCLILDFVIFKNYSTVIFKYNEIENKTTDSILIMEQRIESIYVKGHDIVNRVTYSIFDYRFYEHLIRILKPKCVLFLLKYLIKYLIFEFVITNI